MSVAPHHQCAGECKGCPFRRPKVGSKGNPEAGIVFVAESPGYQEVREGEPLVGPSGRIFHEFVPPAIDGEEGEIYVLNALECCPPTALKGEKRMNEAVLACHDRLIEKVAAHPRRIIVAMGNPALRSLTGNMSLKITQVRGKLIPSPYSELGILPVVHIAALMRGTGSFRQWKEDIAYAMELGRGGDPKVYDEGEVQIVPESVGEEGVDAIMDLVVSLNNRPTADLETSALHTRPLAYTNTKKGLIAEQRPRGEILSIGITPDHDTRISYCFWPSHLPYLQKWFENRQIKWNYHNGKFDVKFLRAAGIDARVDDDTMLMSYALDESGGVHGLETVASDVLAAPDYKYMVQPYLPNKDASYALIPKDVLAEYQMYDTCNTARIRKHYSKRVKDDPALDKLYNRVLLPASEFLSRVENNGIQVDPQRLQDNDTYFGDMLDKERSVVQEICGYDINPGSPQQVADLLYKRMRLPKIRQAKKSLTGEATLEALYAKYDHPIFPAILAFRKAVKMRGTYVKGIMRWMTPEGRVHSTYLIHGTRTGRLSSREPNLQNPPRDPQIRGTFVAAEGYELIEVDLSQAELRSLAALSGDPLMVEVYNDGRDLHSELAVRLFGDDWARRYALKDKENPEFQLAYEQRTRCKNVNFGIVYGITPVGLRDQTGLPLVECIELLDGWYGTFETAGKFIGKCRECPTRNQVITTTFGRKKRVGLVSGSNLNFLRNEAANFPHQSIASDINLVTGTRIEPTLRQWGVRVVNLVHDSLILEVPLEAGLREKVIEYATSEMVKTPVEWGITKVPFVSDAEVGDRWGYLKEWKKEAA